jgi:hypothetical protein
MLDWLYDPCSVWRFQSLLSLFEESRGDDRLDEKTWFYHCLLCFKGFPILEKVILFLMCFLSFGEIRFLFIGLTYVPIINSNLYILLQPVYKSVLTNYLI